MSYLSLSTKPGDGERVVRIVTPTGTPAVYAAAPQHTTATDARLFGHPLAFYWPRLGWCDRNGHACSARDIATYEALKVTP